MKHARDVSQDRGRLLFDETEMESFISVMRGNLWKIIQFFSIGTFFVLLGIRALLIGDWPQAVYVAVIIGASGSYYIAFVIWKARGSAFPTKVFENGIEVGWRTRKQLNLGTDDYIPFEGIEEVYFDGSFGYRPNNENPKWAKKFDPQFDLEAFYTSLKGRVKIERNAHVSPEGQVVWEYPVNLKIEDLSFELQWRDGKKQVMFDDMTGLVRRGIFAIVTPRDEIDFAIKLDGEMLRRLERAWITYQERLWEYPEAEEERWERMEASLREREA